MAIPRPDDFLVRQKAKADEARPAEEAVFTWFGPVDTTERFRFLVVREDGEAISILPSDTARFKTGLKALRWDKAEGGASTPYLVVKTRSNRIDLRKVAPPASKPLDAPAGAP